ncbi:MAG: cytochrome c3 family protein [Candidatus Thiodiazotropha sp.]|jgi:hypothetical protein
MKYKKLLLIVTLNLVVLVTLVITMPHLMITPGKPIQAHREFADDCFACHTPFIGSQPEKCMACHKVSEIGIKTTKGLSIGGEKKSVAFHQNLVEEECVACHSDHNGVMAFRPISSFSHELVEVNVREQCNGCHSNPDDNLHRKIEGNCSQCHNIDAWQPATFDHDDYFRFDHHHDAECKACHIDNDYTNYTCYGCHEHSRSNIREEHFEEGIGDYENCVECHRSGDEDEAERLWRSRSNGLYRSREENDHREYGEGYRRRWHDDD